MSSAPGIYLQALPIELSLGYAERAEESGFGSVWLSEITFDFPGYLSVIERTLETMRSG